MKCKDCAFYKDHWCAIKVDSPDPDIERFCSCFMRSDHWVPVEEGLPKKSGFYLVWSGSDIEIACFSREKCPRFGLDFGWCSFWEKLGIYEKYEKAVTHWMPLPEPPKREGENG